MLREKHKRKKHVVNQVANEVPHSSVDDESVRKKIVEDVKRRFKKRGIAK